MAKKKKSLWLILKENFSLSNFSITLQLFMVIVVMFIIFFSFEIVINFSIKTILASQLPAAVSDDYYDKLMVYQTMALGLMIFIFGVFAIYIKRLFSDPINEFRIVTKEISNLHFGIYANIGSNKEYKDLSGSINDLSDSLEKTINNLNEKNKEILAYSKELEEQFEAKKTLVSNVSHEIKTPLTVIQTTIMAMKDGIIEPSDYDKEMDNMLSEVSNTITLLQEIIEIYKIDSNAFDLTLETLDLNEIIKNRVNDFKSQISIKKMRVIDSIDEAIFIEGDRKLIIRAIDNILLNAVKYSPEKSEIIIKVTDNLFEEEISFTNTNITIPEEGITKLFDPFYRVDKSRTKKEDGGNGLGLFIVKEIFNKHKIRYRIENVNNGVKFSIILEKNRKKEIVS